LALVKRQRDGARSHFMLLRRTLQPAIALLFGTVPLAPLAAQGALERARALAGRGQFDSALSVIEPAARAEPDNAELHYWLGEIACSRAGQIGGLGALSTARKCKAAYSRAVELAPDSVRYLRGLAGYVSQAPGIAGGDRDSAIVLAERVMQLDEAQGTFLLAGMLWRGNRGQKARADSLVEAFSRGHSDRMQQLRVAGYWAQTERTERALVVVERLLSRDSTDVVARYSAARSLVVLRRDPERAIAHLRYILARPLPSGDGPSYSPAGAWWRLGQAFVQLGQPDSARAAYEQSLRFQPELRQARMSLDSLNRSTSRQRE
jgi:tetratricopeptide (TPR) repeat protein